MPYVFGKTKHWISLWRQSLQAIVKLCTSLIRSLMTINWGWCLCWLQFPGGLVGSVQWIRSLQTFRFVWNTSIKSIPNGDIADEIVCIGGLEMSPFGILWIEVLRGSACVVEFELTTLQCWIRAHWVSRQNSQVKKKKGKSPQRHCQPPAQPRHRLHSLEKPELQPSRKTN